MYKIQISLLESVLVLEEALIHVAMKLFRHSEASNFLCITYIITWIEIQREDLGLPLWASSEKRQDSNIITRLIHEGLLLTVFSKLNKKCLSTSIFLCNSHLLQWNLQSRNSQYIEANILRLIASWLFIMTHQDVLSRIFKRSQASATQWHKKVDFLLEKFWLVSNTYCWAIGDSLLLLFHLCILTDGSADCNALLDFSISLMEVTGVFFNFSFGTRIMSVINYLSCNH